MAATRYPNNDLRRQVGSPRSKGRESRDTPCRNVLIYGYCRYKNNGCAFSHDEDKESSQQPENNTKAFNVDSPSFTPSTQQSAAMNSKKPTTFSSQAASAAPFTPRGASSTPTPTATGKSAFDPTQIREFTPQAQNYDLGNTTSTNGAQDSGGLFNNDPFSGISQIGHALPAGTQFNPYAGDQAGMTSSGHAYYGQQFHAGPVTLPGVHLYQPVNSSPLTLAEYQRTPADYAMSADLRREIHEKMFAMTQTLPSRSPMSETDVPDETKSSPDNRLPTLELWHTLHPLDTNPRKSATSFGHTSWIYRAQSSVNGRQYALRRLEGTASEQDDECVLTKSGYRLTNAQAIKHVIEAWKEINNASIVSVHEIFTTRAFGDSSLIFAYDFWPLSKTLQEQWFPQFNSSRGVRLINTPSPATMWTYMCQIANALRVIHSKKLAARSIEASKIIITGPGQNRIRLAACSILDVVNYGVTTKTLEELQQEDLIKFGKLMLSLAVLTPTSHLNVSVMLDTVKTKYGEALRDAIQWLIKPDVGGNKDIANFISGIAMHMMDEVDQDLQARDKDTWELWKEVENARLFRITAKLNTILERGEVMPNGQLWSETGERYQLKIFRDYVFHQVDNEAKPVISLAHIYTTLNKFDAGVEEQVLLTSRDNETIFVVTYRELKAMFERAWTELCKGGRSRGSNLHGSV
ncbi:hypothetical protein OQA88_4489 [Cercophora sp. LCS_1]